MKLTLLSPPEITVKNQLKENTEIVTEWEKKRSPLGYKKTYCGMQITWYPTSSQMLYQFKNCTLLRQKIQIRKSRLRNTAVGTWNRRAKNQLTKLRVICLRSMTFKIPACRPRTWLLRHQETRFFSGRWYVLVGPGWRKPVKCIPGLLWHDVMQWRMDHVLHYRWICQTQDRSHIQRSVSLWKWRLQDQL